MNSNGLKLVYLDHKACQLWFINAYRGYEFSILLYGGFFFSNKDKSHVFIPSRIGDKIISGVTYFYPLEYQSFSYSKLLAYGYDDDDDDGSVSLLRRKDC